MKKKEQTKVKKAVILAGGLGTRFLPETIGLAKELFPIGNKPIIMFHMEDLIKAGIEELLVVGNHLKEESISSFFNPSEEYLQKLSDENKLQNVEDYLEVLSKLKISYVNQEIGSKIYKAELEDESDVEKRGSAIAVLAAKNWTNGETFVVLNGDDLCIYPDGRSVTGEVLDIYHETGDNVVYGKELPRDVIYRYSSMVIGKKTKSGKGFKMNDIVEKPEKGKEPSTVMGFARYVFNDEIYEKILGATPRPNGEICITDALASLAKEKKVSSCIFEGDYFDCGSEEKYSFANIYKVFNSLGDSERKKYLSEIKELISYLEKSNSSKKKVVNPSQPE